MNLEREQAIAGSNSTAEKSPAELVRERNNQLDKQLNPEGSLPEVSVTLLDGELKPTNGTLPSDVFDSNAGMLMIAAAGSDEIIGDVVYGKDTAAPNKLVLTDVSILPQVQGRGFGRRLYLEALKALPAGYGAVCHSMLSPDTEKVWQELVALGIARERSSAVSGQLGRYETTF